MGQEASMWKILLIIKYINSKEKIQFSLTAIKNESSIPSEIFPIMRAYIIINRT